ncbi:MAG: hypothetical protein M3Q29_23220 [Chloroflexota bacterium]|nr:hypothetical protein [Chloroflexota bacterium]
MTAGARGQVRGVGRRRSRAAARLVWSVWVLVITLAAASLVLRLWNAAALRSSVVGAERLSELVWWDVLIPALVPAYATVGAIVAWRRPTNGVGWLCLALGLLVALEDATWQYAARALEVVPGSLPAGPYAALTAQFLIAVMLVPFVLMLLIFPDGRLLSRRWRLVAWVAFAGAGLEVLGVVAAPTLYAGLETEIDNPTGIEGFGNVAGTISEVGFIVWLLTLVAAMISVFVRWRGAGGIERQQLKWFAYTVAIVAAAVFGGAVSGYVSGISYPTVLIVSVAIAGITVGIPVAIGIAVLRYRLYDIDLLINRTLVYATLTAALGLAYLGSVVLLQAVFRTLSGQESQLAVVASTLAIAALFGPLRRRVQSFIDRRFYRRKYDARKTLEAFSAKLRDETDLEVLSDDLVGAVRETMQPAHLSLWLRPDPEPKGE